MSIPPVQIHKLFLNYVFLKEIKNHSKGISGYQLRKVINNILTKRFKKKDGKFHSFISQSLVYREFRYLKKNGLIDQEKAVINNRNQILYKLNEKGEKQINNLERILLRLIPDENLEKFSEDFLSGKISPLEIISNNIPKKQLLEKLKSWRGEMQKQLKIINKKIEEIEKESG